MVLYMYINLNYIKNSLMYNDTSLAYVIPEERSLDIDTENDFMYAEFLINKVQQTNEIR